MAAPLPNLADLEAEWAEFMHDRAGDRKGWSQDQKWRTDNPGKLASLLTYRGGGPRPDFSTAKPGSPERRMIRHLDAYIKAKGSADPVPAYKKVAPITVRQEGGSDQRVCLFENGNLRPGVFRRADGTYGDESGAVYAADADGLEDSSIRTKVTDPALVGAKSMDGRSACECPPVGDPTKNTGSWTV